jgi:4-carboxymuconolactone decarboxylase
MKSLNEREQLFVALGAAIGSNCVPCVEKIVPKAKAAGIENWELRLALNAADGMAGEMLDDDPCPLDQMESAPVATADENASNKSSCCG